MNNKPVKIIFSCINGALSILGLYFICSFLLNIIAGAEVNILLAPLFIFILFTFNIYAIWRFPGYIISGVQIFLTLLFAVIVELAFSILFPLIEKIITNAEPNIDLTRMKDFLIIPDILYGISFLISGYICINIYQNYKQKKASKN